MALTSENNAVGDNRGFASLFGEVASNIGQQVKAVEPIGDIAGTSAHDYERQGNWFTDIFNPGMQAAYDKKFTIAREDSAYQRKVQDLLKAGLNPILAAGGQGLESSFNVSPPPKGEGGKFFPTAPEVLSAVISIISAEKDLKIKDEEIDNLRQDVINKKQDLANKKTEEEVKKATVGLINSQTSSNDRDTEFKFKRNREYERNLLVERLTRLINPLSWFAKNEPEPSTYYDWKPPITMQYDWNGSPSGWDYIPKINLYKKSKKKGR